MSLPLNKSLSRKEKFNAHLRLARISNSPTVFTNVLAGSALAGALENGLFTEPIIGTLLPVMLAMGLFYTAGMYLNDIFDYEIDLKERPERPLPSGQISLKTAKIFTGFFFTSGLLLLGYVGLSSFISGLVLIGLIIFYDYWHKTNPFGHYVMALTRVMVYVTAFVSFSGVIANELIISSILLFLYVGGLTFIAKSENKPNFTRYWPVIFIILPAVYFGIQLDIAFLPVVILFLAWSLHSLTYIYRNQKKDIGGGIVRLIAGISLFDAMVVGQFGVFWPILIVLLFFGLTRYFQSYIEGS